jgi:phosphohistidine phosphatase SixA
MPSSSHLRIQTAFEPFSAETTRSHFVTAPPQKKQKMSLTQTYYIAASARSKLGKEACRADHDLRLLVGHANLLDSLMLELQDAERQQEAWFHSTVAKANKAEQQQRQQQHIQWADSITEEDGDSDSDSESDYYDEDGDFDMVALPRRLVQSPVEITTTEVDEDEDEDEDEYDDLEDDAGLALTRVSSQSPPELVHDEDSDDELPPVSPPQVSMEFSEKEAMLTTSFYDSKPEAYMEDALFLPEPNAPLITSY